MRKTIIIITLVLFASLALAAEFYKFPRVNNVQSRDIHMIRRPAAAGFDNNTGTRNVPAATLLAVFQTRSAATQKATLRQQATFSGISTSQLSTNNINLSGTLSGDPLASRIGPVNWISAVNGGINYLTAPFLYSPSGFRETASIFSAIDNIPAAQVKSDWAAVGTVAEILNKPVIPAAQVKSDWNASGTIAEVLNKPFIPVACGSDPDRALFDGATGATGATGAAGADGVPGANGADGKTVLSGSGAPSAGIGTDGDFYINIDLAHIYGPKASGAWPGIYTELVGPIGPEGPPGPAGNVTQAIVLGVLDDATDGAILWVQQGATEAGTAAKTGVKDSAGNSKSWTDGNGTVFRQCIASDTAAAFTMLNSGGTVIYSVACNNTMTFTGTVTIK